MIGGVLIALGAMFLAATCIEATQRMIDRSNVRAIQRRARSMPALGSSGCHHESEGGRWCGRCGCKREVICGR